MKLRAPTRLLAFFTLLLTLTACKGQPEGGAAADATAPPESQAPSGSADASAAPAPPRSADATSAAATSPTEADASSAATAKTPTTRPEPGPMPAFNPPLPERFTLANGLTVWHLQQQLPLVTMRLNIPYGSSSVPESHAGLAMFVASMLDEGTTTRSALELSDAVDILGATLSTGAGRDSSHITLQVLERNLDAGVELMADVLLNPAFKASELDRVRTLWSSSLKQRRDDPGQVARLVGSRLFFGEDHPYAHSIRGYEASVANFTEAAVKDFHAKHWIPNGATLVVVGSVSRERLEALLNTHLGAWKKVEAAPPVVTPAAPAVKRRLVIVDKPDAPQTVVRLIFPGPPRNTEGYAERVLFNTLFGGSFTSRLNQNLREKNGYTYGAGSGFSFLRGEGIFIASSSVRTEVTGASLKEFITEFGRIAAGDIQADELERAQATEKSDIVQLFQTQSGIVGEYSDLALNGLQPNVFTQMVRDIDGATVEQLNATAKTLAPLANATLVLVGDRKAILEQLEGIDWGGVEPAFYDQEGEPVPAK